MPDDEDWKPLALDIYRIAMGEVIARWSRLADLEGAYLCDELREALLDVKQAVIEDDEDFFRRAVAEVLEVCETLKARYPEAP